MNFEIFKEKFLTTEGRLNRLKYFKYLVFSILGFLIVDIALQVPVAIITGDAEGTLTKAVNVVAQFCWFMIYLCLVIRRLHDLDRRDLFAFLVLIPFVNILFEIYLLFFKGTNGFNKYGPDPLL